LTYQFSYVYEHYTDATNAIKTTNAVNGIIPTYFVSDFSGFVQWKKLKLEAGINNLFDQYYFTRRASGYPGPGILPADPRTFYVTLQLKL
jgi:Fe(3+) dicitrate transport protein